MRIKKLNVLAYVIFILAVLVQIDAADKEFERELRTGRSDSSSQRSVDRSLDINNNEQSQPNRNSIVHGEPNKSSFNKDRR